MGYIAENSRKFFHPAAINEMLSTFLPLLDGTKLDVSQFSSLSRMTC
jgi:proteasome activator subunit 4